ncbi:MAG: hypothetical protein AB8I69_02070 [Anaerolineae bacterium]|jgi:hypothetical protein
MVKEKKEPVLSPKGIQKLLKGGGKKLTDDERALLLALASVEADNLSEQEREALDKLKGQVKNYDAEALVQAVEHMVTAKPVEERKIEWPELKGRRKKRQRRSSQK